MRRRLYHPHHHQVEKSNYTTWYMSSKTELLSVPLPPPVPNPPLIISATYKYDYTQNSRKNNNYLLSLYTWTQTEDDEETCVWNEWNDILILRITIHNHYANRKRNRLTYKFKKMCLRRRYLITSLFMARLQTETNHLPLHDESVWLIDDWWIDWLINELIESTWNANTHTHTHT